MKCTDEKWKLKKILSWRFEGKKTEDQAANLPWMNDMVGHLFQNYDTIYVRFIPKYMTIFLQTRIYMRPKNPIYMRYKQACGIWGYRKSSYKRHRIESSMAAMAALTSSKIWFLFIGLTVVVVVGSPTTDLLESVDCLLRDCVRYFTNAD